MSGQSYIRTEMLPEQPAPLGETGIPHWLRENMFSNWLNGIVSVVAMAFVAYVLYLFLPWAIQGTWGYGSRTECLEAVGGDAACWGVIRDRFNQLMFGFYPYAEQWRPMLAFVLMLVAVAPILFDKLPRKMLMFSALYPFIGAWLLWGGTIWTPLMVLAGFFIGYIVFRIAEGLLGDLVGIILAILATVIWWLFLVGPVIGFLGGTEATADAAATPGLLPWGIESVKSSDFGGLMLSLTIGTSGIVLSFPLGIILALGRQSDMFLVKTFSVIYIEFIRGVPLITLLFVAHVLLNYFLPPGTSFDLILRVVIMVTMFAAAYMAEIIRGGLAALPTGQYEAADALGLDYWKSMRLIIMPQALKISIPGIVGTFIGLFKDTTLVSIIGLMDPVGLTNAIRGTTDWNGIVWELYLFIAVMFWIFTFSMSRYSMYLERKLQTGH